jgi:hypothetical protein
MGHRTGYLAAIWGLIGWFAFLILGVSAEPSPGAGGFYLLALLSWAISIVGMYVDLDNLDRELADTSPALWVLGAVLLYIVAVPWYVYKRHTVAR